MLRFGEAVQSYSTSEQDWPAIPLPEDPSRVAKPFGVFWTMWTRFSLPKAITDVYVRSDGYVIAVLSSSPGSYVEPVLIVFDEKGLFRRCGNLDMDGQCFGFPYCDPKGWPYLIPYEPKD